MLAALTTGPAAARVCFAPRPLHGASLSRARRAGLRDRCIGRIRLPGADYARRRPINGPRQNRRPSSCRGERERDGPRPRGQRTGQWLIAAGGQEPQEQRHQRRSALAQLRAGPVQELADRRLRPAQAGGDLTMAATGELPLHQRAALGLRQGRHRRERASHALSPQHHIVRGLGSAGYLGQRPNRGLAPQHPEGGVMGDPEQPRAEPEVRARARDRAIRDQQCILDGVLRLGRRHQPTAMTQQWLSVPPDDRLERLVATAAREIYQMLVGLVAKLMIAVGGNGDPGPRTNMTRPSPSVLPVRRTRYQELRRGRGASCLRPGGRSRDAGEHRRARQLARAAASAFCPTPAVIAGGRRDRSAPRARPGPATRIPPRPVGVPLAASASHRTMRQRTAGTAAPLTVGPSGVWQLSCLSPNRREDHARRAGLVIVLTRP
jgi:hypothetical protein